jgi:two-component system, NarL family, response regulator DevR
MLVDDHQVVRLGVRDVLEADGRLAVVAEAATCGEALLRAAELAPDVAVLDVRLPDGDGIELCGELRSLHPDMACVVLTSFDDEDARDGAVVAGASGYLLKQVGGNDLAEQIWAVAEGASLIDPRVAARAFERTSGNGNRSGLGSLNPNEQAILDLIGEGLTNRQIGERLCLAEKTVKNYVSHLLRKLGLSRRTEAAVLAVRERERVRYTS